MNYFQLMVEARHRQLEAERRNTQGRIRAEKTKQAHKTRRLPRFLSLFLMK